MTNIIRNALATIGVAKAGGEFDPADAEAAYAEAFGPGVPFRVEWGRSAHRASTSTAGY